MHDVEGGGGGASRIVANGKLEGKGSGHAIFSGGSWNPHQNCKQFATTNDHHVRGWDVRSMKQAWHVQECFSTIIRLETEIKFPHPGVVTNSIIFC